MNLQGTSVSVYDAGMGKWRQTWVSTQGSYLDLTGGWEADAPDGPRMVFAAITADAFDWQWQASEDGGVTWQAQWTIRYTRR